MLPTLAVRLASFSGALPRSSWRVRRCCLNIGKSEAKGNVESSEGHVWYAT